MARHLRPLLFTTAAVATLVTGSTAAGAVAPVLPPGVTLPNRISDYTSTTVAPTTTAPPVTVPPTTTAPVVTTPPGETKIIPVSPPQGATKIVTGPPATSASPGAGSSATTTTTMPGGASPQPSLTPGQVDQVLRTMERSGASSTSALVEALKPLQALGMTAPEALALGMGRFPIQGLANWTDDWLDFRQGPPVHQHMGNDLFTAFDTPVRAPADGTVRVADEGLGGLAAYVTTSDGTYYYMAHLKRFALPSGVAVKQGQTVGFAGDTGNASGGAPHVHFEIHPGGGAAVNPKPIIDGWVADALRNVPALIASLQPAPPPGAVADEGVVPQILVDTGRTRRFSPSRATDSLPAGDVGTAVPAPPVVAPPAPTGPPPIAD